MTRRFQYLGGEGFGTYEIDTTTMSAVRMDGAAEAILVPGFVDIHVHGGFGIDFMTGTSESLHCLCRKFEAVGYDGFLPTTVSASLSAVQQAISTLSADPAILGFHLEGPFISRRFPGAQPQDAIIAPPPVGSDWDSVLNDPRLKVVTMAPEEPGALELIHRLSDRGVVVSMGHTDATLGQAKAGFEAGARDTTHTFNAMRGLHHREAGTVGFALLEDRLTCELIYDRVHVSPPAAAVLVKSKPKEKLVAISDGTMASGLEPGTRFKMWGLDVVVGNGDVRLLDGTLAGSSITLLDAFRNLHDDFGPETAIRATSLNPRAAVSLGPPRVHIELDRSLQIVSRWVGPS